MSTPQEVTKEKAERWTRRRAFAQVRHSSNIQLLPYSLVSAHFAFSKVLSSCAAIPSRRGHHSAFLTPSITGTVHSGSTMQHELPGNIWPQECLQAPQARDPGLGNEEPPKAPSDVTGPPWLQRGRGRTHRSEGDRLARLEAEPTPDQHATRLGLSRVTAPAGGLGSHALMAIRRSSWRHHHPSAARYERAADVM